MTWKNGCWLLFFLILDRSAAAMEKVQPPFTDSHGVRFRAHPSHPVISHIFSFLDDHSLLSFRELGKNQARLVEEEFYGRDDISTPFSCLISQENKIHAYPHTASYCLRKNMKKALSYLHFFRINNKPIKKDLLKAALFLRCVDFCDKWGHPAQTLFFHASELFQKGKCAFNVDVFEESLTKGLVDAQEIRMMIMIDYLSQGSAPYCREQSLKIAINFLRFRKPQMANFFLDQIAMKLTKLDLSHEAKWLLHTFLFLRDARPRVKHGSQRG